MPQKAPKAPFQFDYNPTRLDFPQDGSRALLPLCLTYSELQMLMQAVTIQQYKMPDADVDLIYSVLQGLEYVNQIENVPCAELGRGQDRCYEYAPTWGGISWTKYNPFTENDPIAIDNPLLPFLPDIALPPWIVFAVSTTPFIQGAIDFLKNFFDLDALVNELFGYRNGDVITTVGQFEAATGGLAALNNGTFQFPGFDLQVQGAGVIELHLLSVPFGGRAYIGVDENGIDISGFTDIPAFLANLAIEIADPNQTMVELNRDISSLPPELTELYIYEVEITEPGPHTIHVRFLPSIDLSLDLSDLLGFGGGLRKIVLCGFDEQADDTNGTDTLEDLIVSTPTDLENAVSNGIRSFFCSCGCGDTGLGGDSGGGSGGATAGFDFEDANSDGLDDRYNVTSSELAQAVRLGGAFGQVEGFYNSAKQITAFLLSTGPTQQQIEGYLNDIYDTDSAQVTDFAASWVTNPVLVAATAEEMTTELAHVDHIFCKGLNGGAAVRRESYKHGGGLTDDQIELTRLLSRVFSDAQYAIWDGQGRSRPRFRVPLMSCYVFPPFEMKIDNPAAAGAFDEYQAESVDSYPAREKQGFVISAAGVVTDSDGRRRDAVFREATPGQEDWQFDPLREIEFRDGQAFGLMPFQGDVSFSPDHVYSWSRESDMEGKAQFKIDDMEPDGLTGSIVLTVTHTGSEVEAS